MLLEKNIQGFSAQGTVYSQEDAAREEYSRSFSTGYSVAVKKMLPWKNIQGVSVLGTVNIQGDAAREEYSRSFSSGYC